MAANLEYQALDARIMEIVEKYKRETGKDVVFVEKDKYPGISPKLGMNANGEIEIVGWEINIPPVEWYQANRNKITNIEEAQIDTKIHEVGHLIDPSGQTLDGLPTIKDPNYQKKYAEDELNTQGFKEEFYNANGVKMPSDIADFNKKYNEGYIPQVGGKAEAEEAMKEGKQWAKEQFKDFGWEPIPQEGSWWDQLGDWFNDVGNALNNLLPDWAREWFGLNRTGYANYFRDPLTLDLDGDGIETIGHNGSNGVMFDHDASGIKNPTGWVKSDDGLLVLDRNGDGIINDGSELFGDSTLLANGDKAAHGFAALADLDSNGDGVIDANDTAFSQLKVWRDLNGDGISQANELFSLNDLGIASLNLEYKNTNIGLTGNNQLAQIGSYTKTDGTTGQMGDVNFNFDPLANQFTDPITLTPEQEKAANVSGMGRLRDLREAAALSVDLANKLAAYSNATTKEAQLALLPDLLEAWARTDPKFNKEYDKIDFAVAEHDPNSSNTGNANISPITSLPKELQDRWKNLPLLVAILDSFTNMTSEKLAYTSVADAERICNVIENTFAQVMSGSYQALLLQTRLKPYMDAISLTIKSGEFSLDFTPVLDKFEEVFAQNGQKAFVDLAEFLASQDPKSLWIEGASLLGQYIERAQNQGIYTEWLGALGTDVVSKLGIIAGSSGNDLIQGTNQAEMLFGGMGHDTIYGGDGNNFLDGGDGNDILYGGAGNDILLGGAGDDIIYGQSNYYRSASHDRLIGGEGNDILYGGYGDDVYVFAKGHGQDIIIEDYWSSGYGWDSAFDTIEFTDTLVNPVIHKIVGNDLVLYGYYNSDESITLKNYFSNPSHRVEQIRFADGSTLSIEAMLKAGVNFLGTDGDDVLTGLAGRDVMYGGLGNDILKGGDGDNLLDGGEGDDVLYGGSGNDTLIGGAGNDILYGQENGTIRAPSHDRLIGGEGNDTLYGGYGNDVYVFAKGHGQDIIIEDYWSSAYGWDSAFDTIEFTDALEHAISHRKEGNDLILYGYYENGEQITIKNHFSDSSRTVEQIKLADGSIISMAELLKNGVNILGTDGDDVLTGLAGRDLMYGGLGNDILKGGAGDNLLDGGEGNDILYGGTGHDTLIGGAGDDILYGQEDASIRVKNHDRLIGGEGNDTLYGGYGDDVYVFAKGHGQDIIIEDYWSSMSSWDSAIDSLEFTDPLDAPIQSKREGNDLVLYGYYAGDESITIKNHFSDSSRRVEYIKLADGTQLLLNDVLKNGIHFMGTTGNDVLTGDDHNDILIGGLGNDQFTGGKGDDAYVFGNSHGKDVISDIAGNDRILFEGNQSSNNLWFSRQGNNLLIETLGTSDSITVNSWFSNATYQIETIQLSTGQALINQQVQSLISAMASFAPAAGSSIDVATQKQDYLAQIGVSSYWDK